MNPDLLRALAQQNYPPPPFPPSKNIRSKDPRDRLGNSYWKIFELLQALQGDYGNSRGQAGMLPPGF